MDSLWQDLRYAARVLRKAPGFTLTAIIVIAIGIGANGAAFSLVDTLLLRPLPYPEPQQIVELWERPPGFELNSVSPLNFQDWNDQNQVFSSMAAISGGSKTLTNASGEAERIRGQAVTQSFFKLFGVAPIAGRVFVADDFQPGATAVIVSEALWKSHFGRDPGTVGRTILLDNQPHTIVGIMPATFQVAYTSQLWSPYIVKRSPNQRSIHYLIVYGRLKPGATLDGARANFETIAAGIAAASPGTNKGWSVTIDPLRQAMVGDDLRTTSLVLCGVAAFVLLMGCANVASLLLARGTGRTREIAVRAALGVTPARLIQQLLTESILLAALGGVAGVALAWMIVSAAPALLPPDTLPVGLHLSLDTHVIVFACAATLVTGVLFGLAPAWQGLRLSAGDALRAGGRTATGGTGFRTALAAAEIGVAVMLATGAGLLLRTLSSLNGVDPGFLAPNVVTMQVSLPMSRYTMSSAPRFYERLEKEIGAVPGVRSVGLGTTLPLDGWDIGQGFEVVGRPPASRSERPAAHYEMISPNWFDTLGITLLKGRAFTEQDNAQSPQVCIVNEEFVRRNLNGMNPVGARLKVESMVTTGPETVECEIVGVIHQVKVEGLGEKADAMELYVPIRQHSWFAAAVAVSAKGDALAVVPAVKEALKRVDKDLPFTRIRTMDEVAAETIAQPRFRAELVGAFAALALVLAAVGVFGVLAFWVSQRTREFGIRMALGAQTADVLRLVLRCGIRIAAAGVAAGVVGAGVLARSLGALLYGVKPLDLVAFTGAATLLALVALAACAIPAWHASRVKPALALNQE